MVPSGDCDGDRMTGGETPVPPVDSSSMLDQEFRSFWWNEDFIQLLATRLRLDSVDDMLDIGCGYGHWSETLVPYLSDTARVTGVDSKAAQLEHARQRLRRLVDANRATLLQAKAERLPFENGTFDLVTCQTVLMHLADPLAAVREMARVARPGGTVLVVEPNNLAAQLMPHSHSPEDSAFWSERVNFYYTCLRGRKALGHGDIAIGPHTPNLLREAGLAKVQAWLSDKVTLLSPPYAEDDEQSLLDAIKESHENANHPFPREMALRYYVAGGGEREDFELGWQRYREDQDDALRQFEDGRASATLGWFMYVVAGTAH